MADVKELIERLRGDIFDAVPDDNDMQNVLSVAADALEAEHAEVERLRGELEALNNANAHTVAKWSQEIGRVETLTAQLQAVCEYAEHLGRTLLMRSITRDDLRGILDAAANGGK